MLQPSPDIPHATTEDDMQCRAAIRQGSRTFYAASLILPPAIRRPAYGLYAFCRLSDDAVDLDNGCHQALERLRTRLARAYEGRPLPFPADRAMADLLRRFAIPPEIPGALLEGFAWDIAGRRYATLDELLAYATRVAGTVGVMMTLLMGVRDAQALARACDLGCAMQLTNIARDIGEDARAGRLYLPLDWLHEEGVDAETFLREPHFDDAMAALVARLLAEAEKLYTRSRSGIAQLPLTCRPAIAAAASIYAEIGRLIDRERIDTVRRRAHVSTSRKIQLLANSILEAPFTRGATTAPPLPAATFLIDAVMKMPAQQPSVEAARLAGSRISGSVVRVIEMFERLERAGQLGD